MPPRSLVNEVASLDATGVIIWANGLVEEAAKTDSRDLRWWIPQCELPQDVRCARDSRGTGDRRGRRRRGRGRAWAVRTGAQLHGWRTALETPGQSPSRIIPWRSAHTPLEIRRSSLARDLPTVPGGSQDLPALSRLTPREHEVLRLMIRGLNNREIAAELGIAYTTVRSHAQAVIEKLDARSRLHAVARASHADSGGMMGTVALGIGHQDVTMPAHRTLFDGARPPRAAAQFLRPAIEDPQRASSLFGPPGVARSMLGESRGGSQPVPRDRGSAAGGS